MKLIDESKWQVKTKGKTNVVASYVYDFPEGTKWEDFSQQDQEDAVMQIFDKFLTPETPDE